MRVMDDKPGRYVAILQQPWQFWSCAIVIALLAAFVSIAALARVAHGDAESGKSLLAFAAGVLGVALLFGRVPEIRLELDKPAGTALLSKQRLGIWRTARRWPLSTVVGVAVRARLERQELCLRLQDGSHVVLVARSSLRKTGIRTVWQLHELTLLQQERLIRTFLALQ
jgi:hypothetical protein